MSTSFFRSAVGRAIVLVIAGTAGMVGAGYQAAPSQSAAEAAVRASLAAAQTRSASTGADGERRILSEDALQAVGDASLALQDAKLEFVNFRRDWIHEAISSGPSRFLVDVRVVPADGGTPDPRIYCIHLERQPGGSALASSPKGNGACTASGL